MILSKFQGFYQNFNGSYQNFNDLIKISMDLIKISMMLSNVILHWRSKKQRFSDFLIFCLLVSTCEFTIFSSYLEYFVGRKLNVPMAILEAKYDFRGVLF